MTLTRTCIGSDTWSGSLGTRSDATKRGIHPSEYSLLGMGHALVNYRLFISTELVAISFLDFSVVLFLASGRSCSETSPGRPPRVGEMRRSRTKPHDIQATGFGSGVH